jgi:hypothetical protein
MRTRSLALSLCVFLYAETIPLQGEPPSGVIANSPNPEPEEKTFQWGRAVTQSFAFLAIEHSFRLTQSKTRREFSGKFLPDYFESVSNINGWGDGDGIFTNYIGHPMQGAVASFIQIQNDPQGKHLDFGNNPEYWHSRLKAFAWSAAYSTQFEIGPVSEATIGHVGKTPGTAGAVDLVITPTAGVGLSVLEDVIDRYFIRKMEGNTSSPLRKILLRSTLNPNRAFANVLRGKVPWHRDTRPGVSQLQ